VLITTAKKNFKHWPQNYLGKVIKTSFEKSIVQFRLEAKSFQNILALRSQLFSSLLSNGHNKLER
jgi:hypothetical protein